MPENAEAQQIAAFEQAKGQFREDIDRLENGLATLKCERKKAPRHVRWADLPEPDRFVPLAPTRKRFFDTIMMIAYRAETAMAGLLREVMARPADTRALPRENFATHSNLIPDERAGALTTALHHLTYRSSDEAERFLAQQLNAPETVYPGSNRLRSRKSGVLIPERFGTTRNLSHGERLNLDLNLPVSRKKYVALALRHLLSRSPPE